MSTAITLPYDPAWRAVEWAKQHCPSYITNEAVPPEPRRSLSDSSNEYYIKYYFGNERDAVWFALRWS